MNRYKRKQKTTVNQKPKNSTFVKNELKIIQLQAWWSQILDRNIT